MFLMTTIKEINIITVGNIRSLFLDAWVLKMKGSHNKGEARRDLFHQVQLESCCPNIIAFCVDEGLLNRPDLAHQGLVEYIK